MGVVAVMCVLGACRRQDILTFEIDVPGMTDEASARRAMTAVLGQLAIPPAQVMGASSNASGSIVTLKYSVAKIPPNRKVRPAHIRQMHSDLSRHVVTVTYDSMKMARKNIEFAIANAGMVANEVPANPMQLKKDAPPKPKAP